MRLLPLLLLALAAVSGCSTDEDDSFDYRPTCGSPIQIVDALVEIETDTYGLLDLRVDDRCLSVRIQATGCSSTQFRMDLLTRGEVKESLPTQTSARLIFDDGVPAGNVTCEALVEADFAFDLEPYLHDGVLPTQFTLIGLDTTLLIE
ncbi:hypothetical protein [Lewinella sp. IMCC34191]|uniref:hypothetical protein n=1 Tax=Lewinella sp. IMCC34191 TaxID=2259172 RepID=UPI000E27EA9E|nr:hypothetical protein [Lewinella sp. IMCC34191]